MSVAAAQHSRPRGDDRPPLVTSQLPATDDAGIRACLSRIHHLTAVWDLAAETTRVLVYMLRREYDKPLLQELVRTLAVVVTKSGVSPAVRSHACIKMIQEARDRRLSRTAAASAGEAGCDSASDAAAAAVLAWVERPTSDLQYVLPPHLAKMAERLTYACPVQPPPPCGFEDFRSLAEEAILYRIDSILTFFQRHHPDITRELPLPFLSSPIFASRFRRAVSEVILPQLSLDSRLSRTTGTAHDWRLVDAVQFWEATTPPFRDNLLRNWRAAWASLRLIEAKKDEGQTVWQIKAGMKKVRAMLAPESEWEYTLPRITNREIDVFSSMFDPSTDWATELRAWWKKNHQFYEQEMEPRIYQQQARPGVLRDGLLSFVGNIPREWRDFVILLTHRVFPRIDSRWLTEFARNFGRDDATRATELPYLMAYLSSAADHSDMLRREKADEQEWRTLSAALKRHVKGVD